MNLDFIPAWANAIAQFEGYNSPSSRAARNRNPGNLKFAGQPGVLGKDPDNFAVFSSDVAGFQALYRQLEKYVNDYPSSSLLEITARYLGQSTPTVNAQGDAFTYSAYLASALGVDPSTTLGELVSGSQPSPPIPYELTQQPDGSGQGADGQVAVIAPDGSTVFVASASGDGSAGSSGIGFAIGALFLVWLLSRAWA
jgi:hypothetical protein